MYRCESWTIKKTEHWRIDAFELWCWRRLLSPLDCKEIKQVSPKGSQPWIFIGRTDAEAPILWPPDAKSWLTGKDPDAGKDWRQEEKGMTDNEMVGWHHRPNGHGCEQTPGDGEGQGSLACCSSWSYKELDTTEQLNKKKSKETTLLEKHCFLAWDQCCFSALAWCSVFKPISALNCSVYWFKMASAMLWIVSEK